MKSVRAVQFAYTPTAATRSVLEMFRMLVNYAIQISLKESIRGRLNLRNRIYAEFRDRYSVASCLPYSVAEVAWSIVKKHRRWQRRPYAKQLMMKVDSASYSINDGILSLPFKPGQRIHVPLRYGDWQRSFFGDETLKRGSVTMTDSTVLITFSREKPLMEPLRRVGIDINEKSIVVSDGTRYDMSEVARLHTEYGVRRRDFYSRHPDDRRLKQKFAGSRREKERVRQFLHRVSKQIVAKAVEKREGIVLERLRGIRNRHRRGNGESRNVRRRVGQWPFRQLQHQIEYKAGWEGVPTEYVSPARTSQTCSRCGFVNLKLKRTDREWLCPCGATLDRDLNGAVNIERRGRTVCLAMVQPGARGRDEPVMGNVDNGQPLILGAEAPKPTYPTIS